MVVVPPLCDLVLGFVDADFGAHQMYPTCTKHCNFGQVGCF